MTHDLVVALGGHVLCPATGVDGIADVAIDGGRIAAVGAGLEGRERVEADGLLVVPGLIDLHVHVYEGVSHYGIDADTYLLRRGTTTGVDVGSAGAQTFPGLRRMVIERAQTRVYAYLHIAVEGMISVLVGELEDLRWASVEQCVRVAEANRDVIAGVKLRAGYQMVGPDPRPAVGLALEAADALGLPLMVHVIDMGMPLPELLARMRPGDVVTHCFHGNDGGLLDERGQVWPEAFAARERGILFDVGHGAGSFTWRVTRAALAQDFPPDTISSDIHAHNHAGPVYDLPRTLSKLLHLGMPLADVIAAATARVAAHLAHVAPAGLGTLAAGAPGDLSLLERQRGRFELTDGEHRLSQGVTEYADERLVARTVVRAGAVVACDEPGVTSLRIAGGRVIAHSGVLDGADVLVENGHVVAVGETVQGERELDARGCYVLPGGVDPHAHVYEGLPDAPLAALRSGTTEVAAYAPPEPGERVEDACERWDALAAGAACRIDPLATVYEPHTLDEASFAALGARGVRGIKLFLAYRELGMDADDDVLLRALIWGKAYGVVPRLHCENAGAIQVLRERLRAAGDLGIDAHPRSRPPLVEEEGVRRALDLARLADAPAYIVHVSTAGGVAAIRQARADGLDVIGETCPQYLLLDERVYSGPLAAIGVVSPPLRPRAHVDAVWEGVLDGTLSTIGSDHGHRGSRPAVPFDELVSGGPGVAARMPLMLTAALHDARLPIELATKLLCGGRAVEAGAPADLLVWDPEQLWTLTPATLAEGLDATVWDGTEVRGRPRAVLRNGEVVA